MAARKPHPIPSNQKRPLEFVAEVRTIIENDLSKLIRPITKDMGENELPIRQLVHENIRYFSYKMRKG